MRTIPGILTLFMSMPGAVLAQELVYEKEPLLDFALFALVHWPRSD